MLKLNLLGMTNDEIAETIASHCARFGFVKSITVPETETKRTFALVAMDSADDAEAVETIFGDGWIDDKVMIRLEQEERSIPSSLLRTR
jgi:hypothetical protein